MSLFIWFIFAILCAVVAEHKNRSKITWFIIGCIGGIFALGLLVLLPKIEEEHK